MVTLAKILKISQREFVENYNCTEREAANISPSKMEKTYLKKRRLELTLGKWFCCNKLWKEEPIRLLIVTIMMRNIVKASQGNNASNQLAYNLQHKILSQIKKKKNIISSYD